MKERKERITASNPVRRLAAHLKSAALLAFLATTATAWGATKPLAVWNGDFPTTASPSTNSERGGFVLTLNGNTSDGSTITADSTSGGIHVMEKTQGAGKYKSFIVVAGVRVDTLSYANNPFLFSSYTTRSGKEADYIGTYVQSSSGKFVGSWQGNLSNSGNQNNKVYPSDGATHYLAFSFSHSTSYGTKLYLDATSNRVVNDTSLANSAANEYTYGVSIGGKYNTSGFAFSGAKYNYIAVYANSSNEAENSIGGTGVIDGWIPSGMTSAGTDINTTTTSVGVNLPTTATLTAAATPAAVFVHENATLKLTNGSSLTIGGGTGPLYIAEGKTLTLDASELTLSPATPSVFIAGKIFDKSQISITGLSNPDGCIETDISDDGVTIYYPNKMASFAMGVDDGETGTYVTTTPQLAFDGITLQQFYERGYALCGRFAGGSINNRGILVKGYNPAVTDDGNGNVTSIRYEMKGINNQVKCVVITLTPNAGNTGINVAATPVTVENNTTAALFAASSWPIADAFLSGDTTVTGVSPGTLGTSYGANNSYCLYYLHVSMVGKANKTLAITADTTATVGTDLATAYGTLSVSGSGVLTLAGSHLTVKNIELTGSVTLDTTSLSNIGGLENISIGSGCKIILNPGCDMHAFLSGAGDVEFGSGTTRVVQANTGLTGNIIVKSGATIKAGSGTAFGPTTNSGYTSRRVIVENGGVADVNGFCVETSFRISGDGSGGGALVNNGSNAGDTQRQIYLIEVAANASIGGSGQFGIIRNQNGAAKVKFLSENLVLTKKGTGTFLWSNVTRDTSGYEGTIDVAAGTFKILSKAVDISDGITLKFSGGTLAGNNTLTAGTVYIESGTPCNSYNQALTISTLNINGGSFGRNAKTSVTTMNVGSGATGILNAYNQPTTMTVESGGELNIQNYGASAINLSGKTISGAGTIRAAAGEFTIPDSTLLGFTGNLIMSAGTVNLGAAGFSEKGGVTVTGNAAIKATAATMPIDLRDVASTKTLTLTGAQVDFGTNRPHGAVVMADGTGTSTLSATFAGPSEPTITLNVTGDLTAANVTAYKPGRTSVETGVTKTFDTDAGTLSIALVQIPINANVDYVAYSTLNIPASGTAAITTDHPVTITLSPSDLSGLTTRTDAINLAASSTGSFKIVCPSAVAQSDLPFAGDYELIYDLGTFPAAELTTAITALDGKSISFTNSTEAVVEYTGVLTAGNEATITTYADVKLSNVANTFGTDAILQVGSGSAEFTFASAAAPSSIVILPNAKLSLANTAITGDLSLNGMGTFEVLGALSVSGDVTFHNAMTLAFASGASLTASNFTVLGNYALTIVPCAIAGTSQVLVSSSTITANGAITLVSPEDDSSEYALRTSGTAITLCRSSLPSFSYDAYPNGVGPTGWFNEWNNSWGNNFSTTSFRVGPSSSIPYVYHTTTSKKPCIGLEPRTGKFSLALYADVSAMPSTGRAVMAAFGDSRTAESIFVIYREGSNVKAGVWSKTGVLSGTAASVDIPGNGFQLYTATLDTTTGDIQLFLDGNAAQTGAAGAAVTLSSGFCLGDIWGEINSTGFTKGIDMAVCSVRGYNDALNADNVAVLANDFPSTNGTINWNVLPDTSANTYIIANNTFDNSHYFGISKGTLTIPAGTTVSANHMRVLNNDNTGDSATVNIAGTLNITSTSTNPNVWNDGTDKGVLWGHYHGTATYNITGTVNAPNTYIETVYTAEAQTIDIDGGTIKTKSLYANNDNSTLTLRNGGTIELSEIVSSGNLITRNYKYGTFRIMADATETRAINFSAVAGYATTLDPNGHTLTMKAAAVTGAGDIMVATSANPKGKVVFEGTTDYTGTLFFTDRNKDMIEFSPKGGWRGKVNYAVAGEMNSTFDGFAGTLIIDGVAVDARGIDLSAATVELVNGATLQADAGKESCVAGMTIITGTTLKLYVTEDAYRYEGHSFLGTNSGTLEYYRPDEQDPTTYVQVTDTSVLNGDNLLPYYQTWEVSSGTGSGVVNLATNWKGGNVPTERADSTYGNAAFHVTEDSEITVTVDSTMTFGEIQVYGAGTVIFTPDSANYLATSVLSISDGVTVKIAGDEPIKITDGFIKGGTKLAVNSGASIVLDGVDCSTQLEVVGTLTTKGATTLSSTATTVSGTMEVATGETALSMATRGLTGTLTIDAGAKVVAKTGDAPDYLGASTLNIYGTLETSGVRWSFASNNILNLYAGAIVTGTGDNQGAIDLCHESVVVNILANPAVPAANTVTISSQVRLTANAEINVAEGTTLDITQALWHKNDSGAITKTGLGVLSVKDNNTFNGTCYLNEGQIISTVVPGGNVQIAAGTTYTLRDCEWASGDKFSGTGTLVLNTVTATKNIAATSTFSGTLSVKKDGNAWSVFTGTPPQFANRPTLIVGGTSAGMVLDTDFVGEANALTVKNLNGSGTISSKNGGTAGNRFIDTLQTDNTEFSGKFEAGGSGGYGDRNSSLIVRGAENADQVYYLRLTGASDTKGALIVKKNGGVAFSSVGSWSNSEASARVEDGGHLDVSANSGAIQGALELQAGSTFKVSTAAIPTVVTLTLPTAGSGIVNIETSESVVAANTPLLKVTSGIEADADLGLFTLNGTQCSLVAVETDGGVNICYGVERDDTWNTAATDWTSTTFDTGATYREGMNVTFGPMSEATASHAITIDGTRAPADVTFKAGTAWTITGGTFAPTGTVTLDAGAEVLIESAATGTYVVGTEATLSLANATVTSVSGAGTLNIPEGAVVTLATIGAIDGIGTLSGTGTLVLPNDTKPNAALQTLLQDGSSWRGTVSFVGLTNNNTAGFAMCNYGNDYSTIQFTACTVQYFMQTDNDASSYKKVNPFNGTTRLVKSFDANDVEVPALKMGSNGFSEYVTQFGKLTGDGKFFANSNHSQIYRFTDATEFTGSIYNDSASGRKLVIGNTSPSTKASLTVVSGYAATIGDGATWESLNGITLAGTLHVTGNGTIASELIFESEGATLSFDDIGTAESPKSLTSAAVRAVSETAVVKIEFGDDVDFGSRSSITLMTWTSKTSGVSFMFKDTELQYGWSLVANDTSLVMTPNPEIKDAGDNTVGYVFDSGAVILDTSSGSATLPGGVTVTSVQLIGMDVATFDLHGASLETGLLVGVDENGGMRGFVMSGYTVTAGESKTTIALDAPTVTAGSVTVSGQSYPPMSVTSTGAPVFAIAANAYLWYGIEYSANGVDWVVDASSVQQATSTTILLEGGEASSVSSRVKYFRIGVGGSKQAFGIPAPSGN